MFNVLAINYQPTTKDSEIHEMFLLYCRLRRLPFPPRNGPDGTELFVKLLEILAADEFDV